MLEAHVRASNNDGATACCDADIAKTGRASEIARRYLVDMVRLMATIGRHAFWLEQNVTNARPTRGGDIYAQGVDVSARGVKANKSHAYRAGPKTVVPRGNCEDVRF